MFVKTAWNLLRCAHPEPVFAITAAVGILSLSAGRGWSTGWAMAAVLAGQLFVGWTNDYLDLELDRHSGRADKPLAAGLVRPGLVLDAAVVALVACIPLSLASGLAAGAVHLVAIGLATLYNTSLKSTPASVVPYLVSFGLLPSFITLGLHPGHLPPIWASAGAALLAAGAHFTQVLPDIDAERGLGVRGLPHLLGTRGSTLAAAILLAGSALLILLGPGHPGELQLAALGLTLVLIAGVTFAGLSGRHRLSFRLTLLTAGGVAVIFVLSGQALT